MSLNPALEETVVIDFITSGATGAATNADAPPTAQVFEDAVDVSILSPTVANRGFTGNYRITVPCTAANGFEAGKTYNVVISATVGGVAAKAVAGTFQMRTNQIDGVRSDTAATLSDTNRIFDAAQGVIAAGSFADRVQNKNGAQTFDPATDSLEAARDFQSTIPAATAALVPGGAAAVSGTVNDAGASTTSFITDLASTTNNFYSGLLSFTSGALVGTGGRTVAAYDGITKRITLYKPLPSAPANGVTFNITADDKSGSSQDTGF